jgi:hypothetical protein
MITPTLLRARFFNEPGAGILHAGISDGVVGKPALLWRQFRRKETMNTNAALVPGTFHKRKRNYLLGLVGIGLLDGVLYSHGLSYPSWQVDSQLFITFTFNLCLLGWCYTDAQERKIPITRFLGLALLAIALVGVPWYFIRSRGIIGACKGAFGIGLFLIWLAGILLAFVPSEIIHAQFGR